ncbi:hypothetical protein DV735_g393, partial [Chaetothyriales sp. CBS 134920]
MAPRSLVNRIRRVGTAEAEQYTYYPVLIIGAGESGIAMGCRLRSQLGFDQFRIFERRSGLGGTWYANKYPGVACDVPAICYSFSWYQNPSWTSPFPSGKEIVRYLYDAAAEFEILDKIQLDTSVRSVVWKEDDQEWEVVLDHLASGVGDMGSHERAAYEKVNGPGSGIVRSETVRAKIVVSAVGGLVEPKSFVDVPGIDTFPGQIVHTARWDDSLDVRDKDVVIVGTGCSAAQVLPQLIKPEYGARHVTQLLRSPPWTVQFFSEEVSAWWKKWMPWLCTNVPGFQNAFRKLMFTSLEIEWLTFFKKGEASRQQRKKKGEQLLAYMRKHTPKEYHELLAPNYEVFCKRRVVDEGWYKALGEPNVDITSLPLTRVEGSTVHLGPGRHYPPMSATESKVPTEARQVHADVIIMANGYETNQWLHPLDVTGRGGRSLYKVWEERGGAQAYLGVAMDGFPNFFMIFGPNTVTGHTSVILATENMVNYTLKFVKPILQGDVSTWEVSERAERDWNERVQRDLKDSVYTGGCVNWYKQSNGWNSSTYPYSQVDHTLRCYFPVWSHWHGQYTRKGWFKLALSRGVKLWVASAIIYGLFALSKGGKSAQDVVKQGFGRLRNLLKLGLAGLYAAL